MKSLIAISGAALIAATSLAAPQVAAAQPYEGPDRDFGRGELCHRERQEAATNASIFGAILGGLFGAGVAGHHDRLAGAVIGGGAGALAGHAIGAHSVSCVDYPRRISWHRDNCHWVREFYDQRYHEFEVCRDADGVWRPSGRD